MGSGLTERQHFSQRACAKLPSPDFGINASSNRDVTVLHEHQANPRVHLSMQAAGREGSRLNPRKANLHRWRETFAE